jgi:hypothetical protein
MQTRDQPNPNANCVWYSDISAEMQSRADDESKSNLPMRRDGKCSALPAGVGRVAIGKGVMPVHFSGYHSMCRRRSIIQKSQEPEGSSILEMQTSEHQHGGGSNPASITCQGGETKVVGCNLAAKGWNCGCVCGYVDLQSPERPTSI